MHQYLLLLQSAVWGRGCPWDDTHGELLEGNRRALLGHTAAVPLLGERVFQLSHLFAGQGSCSFGKGGAGHLSFWWRRGCMVEARVLQMSGEMGGREAEHPGLGGRRVPCAHLCPSPTASCWELVNIWCGLGTLTAHLRQSGQVPPAGEGGQQGCWRTG